MYFDTDYAIALDDTGRWRCFENYPDNPKVLGKPENKKDLVWRYRIHATFNAVRLHILNEVIITK